ncbi:unnamed protein product [Prunus armeniaca]
MASQAIGDDDDDDDDLEFCFTQPPNSPSSLSGNGEHELLKLGPRQPQALFLCARLYNLRRVRRPTIPCCHRPDPPFENEPRLLSLYRVGTVKISKGRTLGPPLATSILSPI